MPIILFINELQVFDSRALFDKESNFDKIEDKVYLLTNIHSFYFLFLKEN